MSLDDLKARLAEIEAAESKAFDAQHEADLAAYVGLAEKHGLSNLTRVDIAYTVGLPTMAVARTPLPSEMKRYRDQYKESTARAAEMLAAVCLVYPAADIFSSMVAARPGLASQLGLGAVTLAVGTSGKD